MYFGDIYFMSNYIYDGNVSDLDCQNIVGTLAQRVVILNTYFLTNKDNCYVFYQLPESMRPNYSTVAIIIQNAETGDVVTGGISTSGIVYADALFPKNMKLRINATYFRH